MNRKNRIFIADDDEDYLYQLQFFFEKNDFDVVTASLQSEAEQMIPSLEVDIAILDLMMEHDDSGFILARTLKSHFPQLPVIIATAVATETGITFSDDSRSEGGWIMADLYLEKGIRLEQLLTEVQKLIDKYAQNKS